MGAMDLDGKSHDDEFTQVQQTPPRSRQMQWEGTLGPCLVEHVVFFKVSRATIAFFLSLPTISIWILEKTLH